jgi:hypothetical protein
MSLLNRFPKENHARLSAIERELQTLVTDMQRVWKVMPPEHTGTPGTGLSPVGDPFYTPDPGSTGGGSSSSFDYCTLVTPLWRGTSATATLASNGSTIAVWGRFFGGYGFDGQEFKVEYVSGLYQAIGAGAYWAKGTPATDLSDGGSISLTVRGGKVITVYGDFGEVDSGTLVGASWDDYDARWHVGDARC